MSNRLLLTATSVLILFLTSCIGLGPSTSGNGKVVKQSRALAGFSGIKAVRGMNVYITQDSVQKVVVEADENLLDIIETKIEGNQLIITATENIRNAKSKKVHITVKNLDEITAVAGSNIFTVDTPEFKELIASAVAGSNLNLTIISNLLKVNAVAGSNITLTGHTENLECKSTAGSNVKAQQDFKTSKCLAKVNSGSNVWVTVNNELDANASTGGNVFYAGNPSATEINTSSGGNVIRK